MILTFAFEDLSYYYGKTFDVSDYEYEVDPTEKDLADFLKIPHSIISDLNSKGFINWDEVEKDPDFIAFEEERYAYDAMKECEQEAWDRYAERNLY